jgi:Tol biopolymer transport system component
MNLVDRLKSGKRILRNTALGIGATALLALSACGDGGGGGGSGGDNPGDYRNGTQDTYEIPEAELRNPAFEVDLPPFGYLRFSEPTQFDRGDIIMARAYPNIPGLEHGLFLKVTQMGSSENQVHVVRPTLEDAAAGRNFQFQITTTFTSEGIIIHSNGEQYFSPFANFNLDVNFPINNQPLGNTGVVMNGDFSSQNNFEFNFNMPGGRLRYLEAIVNATQSSNLMASYSGFGKNIDEKITVRRIPLTPISIPTGVVFLPFINISPYIRVFVGAKGEISALNTGITQQATARVGLTYNNGIWTNVAELDNDFNFTPPSFSGNTDVRAFAGVSLDLLVFNAGGPFGDVQGFLDYQSKNFPGTLHGGFKADLGITPGIFSAFVDEYSATVIERRKLLFGEENPDPEPEPDPPNPSLEGKIIAGSVIGLNADIYKMNPNGSGKTSLTNNSSLWEFFAKASLDGSKIFYCRKIAFSGDNSDIWIMDSSGSNKRELIGGGMEECGMEPHPDGERIFYTASFSALHNQIYSARISDGGGMSQITFDNSYNFRGISISPDGNKIVVSSNLHHPNYEIYIMNIDGSNRQRLTNNSVFDHAPRFSRDGSKIYYESNNQIWVMNLDGTNKQNISNNLGTYEMSPILSPSGTRMAYTSRLAGTFAESTEIWVMNSDGSGKTRITNNSYDEGAYDWSP